MRWVGLLGFVGLASITGCKKKRLPPTDAPPWPPAVTIVSATVPKFPPPQEGNAHVRGRVSFGGAPVPGTDVELCTEGCREILWAKTDADGNYAFRDLLAGTYDYLGVRLFESESFHAIWPNRSKPSLLAGAVEIRDAARGPRRARLLGAREGEASHDAVVHDRCSAGSGTLAGRDLRVLHPGFGSELPLNHFRVDDARFVVDRALPNGSYTLTVNAYNAANERLADNAQARKFVVDAK